MITYTHDTLAEKLNNNLELLDHIDELGEKNNAGKFLYATPEGYDRVRLHYQYAVIDCFSNFELYNVKSIVIPKIKNVPVDNQYHKP